MRRGADPTFVELEFRFDPDHLTVMTKDNMLISDKGWREEELAAASRSRWRRPIDPASSVYSHSQARRDDESPTWVLFVAPDRKYAWYVAQ
jgi:hypothetical protein